MRNLGRPLRRLRQVIGMMVHLYPRTMALSGSSTVRLKWGAIRGRHPSMTSLRYTLKALVVSFKWMRNSSLMNKFAARLSHRLTHG